jgi:hypothetical protein
MKVKRKENIFEKLIRLTKALINVFMLFFGSIFNISDETGQEYGQALRKEEYQKNCRIEQPEEEEVRRRELRSYNADGGELGDSHTFSYSITQ